jgi:uncharacterized protein YaaN involved in tellurite resistance
VSTSLLEAYEAEIERMTASLVAENLALANDNKQLSSLIKEYEQTLEGIMTSFRTRAVSHHMFHCNLEP